MRTRVPSSSKPHTNNPESHELYKYGQAIPHIMKHLCRVFETVFFFQHVKTFRPKKKNGVRTRPLSTRRKHSPRVNAYEFQDYLIYNTNTDTCILCTFVLMLLLLLFVLETIAHNLRAVPNGPKRTKKDSFDRTRLMTDQDGGATFYETPRLFSIVANGNARMYISLNGAVR